jgi:hypothetical protein
MGGGLVAPIPPTTLHRAGTGSDRHSILPKNTNTMSLFFGAPCSVS